MACCRVDYQRSSWLAAAFLVAVALLPGAAEEPASADKAPDAAAAAGTTEESDATKQLIDQLTISMASEVIDERTFVVRDAASKTGRKRLPIRLGNVKSPDRGALGDAEYEAKLSKSREALEKLVGKQMIWWKAAPDEHQPQPTADVKAEDVPLVADVWLIDGRHVNGLLHKEGHLVQSEDYASELSRDILTAEADQRKQDSYKELEKAMKESEKERKKAAVAGVKAAAEAEPAEPIGTAGWLGIVVVLVILVGVFFNFGKAGPKKKVNYNRKRGAFESFWTKLKGS